MHVLSELSLLLLPGKKKKKKLQHKFNNRLKIDINIARRNFCIAFQFKR